MQQAGEIDLAAARHAQRKPQATRKRALWTVGGVLIVALAATGWVGYRALSAKDSLEAAQSLIGTVKDQAASADFAGIAQTAALLATHTSDAVTATHDPVWRVGEFVPILGKNLTAVREMSEVVDAIANDTVTPLAAVAGGLGPESLKPIDGRINIDPIVQLSAAMDPAAAAFHEAATRGMAIDVSGTIGPVSEAGALLSGMLGSADALVGDAASILQIAPDLLGANGPRTYVLVFQNLAESTALGGTAAALTELKVDDGAIEIGRQASSGDFPWRDGSPVVAPDPNVEAIFEPLMYTRLNLSTSRPDFPTAAEIAQAFWQEHIGGDVDAVISIDPVALSHLLGATGPIAMSTGDQLSKENAVQLLLNEIYFRYPLEEISRTDDFFEEAAKSVFNALMSPATDAPKLVSALAQGISEHRILAWSSDPAQQEVLANSPMSGILPANNDAATTTGVFFRDMSASKMDFYLKTAAKLNTDVCTSATPTFTTTVDLASTITQEKADALPAYVASGLWGSEHFRTQVFIYGPPGTTLASTEINSQGRLTTFDLGAEDLGRPVASFMVWLAPGQTSQVTATFVGGAGAYATPELRATPMLHATKLAVEAGGCAP
ncbi:Protein of unknown function [Microterricola viridarii]|uniref:DUF4012 domain-containing protein n=2 Tax=Microterricola viridarii TaxID=412690 RepID=A0A1H1ZJF7_9MICO|nr:Protein of unknown function [Microterricola viridarii]